MCMPRKPSLVSAWGLIRQAFAKWWEDNALRLAASLSFYTAFSLSPVLLIVIAVAGVFFGEESVQHALIEQISRLVGPGEAAAVNSMLISAQQPTYGLLSAMVNVATLLTLATGVFVEMQDGLNTLWQSPPAEERPLWRLLKERLLSFLLILGLGFLLVVSLVLDAVLAAVGTYLSALLSAQATVLLVWNFLLSVLVLTMLFAMIFRFLPRIRLPWVAVWLGGGVTALFIILDKFAIGLYIGKAGVASAYGAASSLMIVLLWVYYSSLIFYFGAAFTVTYAQDS